MADEWTYTPENLSSSYLDQVRLKIGDTNIDKPLLVDAEINYYLSETSNDILLTAISCCDAIAARMAKFSKTQANNLRVEIEDVARKYELLADRFRKQSASSSSLFAVLNDSDKDTFTTDTDLIKPAITRGMHDNPGSTDISALRSDT